ncbi:hypothetical protein AgCh_021358 [Apium graveolens]
MCPHSRRFVIYYSQTKTWKTSALGSFIPPVYLAMFNFAYFKGSIYWITTSKVDKLVLSYNVDEDTLTTLPRPPEKVSSFIRRSFYFGESAGHLHIAEVFACAASSLDVYQLNPDHTGWFLKFKVDLYQLSKDLPQMRSNMYTYVDEYAFSILSLVRSREDFDEDSVLVLEVPGKVIVYNLVDQSWKEIGVFSGWNKERIFKSPDDPFGKFEECIKDCEKAVKRGRELRSYFKMVAKALTRKGTALVKMAKCSKDYKPAIEIFQTALAEYPNPDTLKKLNYAEKAKKDLEQQEYFIRK